MPSYTTHHSIVKHIFMYLQGMLGDGVLLCPATIFSIIAALFGCELALLRILVDPLQGMLYSLVPISLLDALETTYSL